MSKRLLVFIVIAGIGTGLYLMKRSADAAKKSSGNILKEFETISKDLDKSTAVIDSANAALPDSLAEKLNK
jgi:hypothetical protein